MLVACATDEEDISPLRVRSVAIALGMTGDPTTERILPSITDPKAQLGMKLFYSKALGLDQDAACVSCHHPVLAGSDDLSLPIGVDAENPDLVGAGRFHLSTAPNWDGGPTVGRNAPTTFNSGMWDRVMTYDGRIESLDKVVNFNGSPGDFGFGIVTPDSVIDDFGTRLADPNAGGNLPTALARFPVTSVEDMRGGSIFPNWSPTTIFETRWPAACPPTRVGGLNSRRFMATNSLPTSALPKRSVNTCARRCS